MPTLSRAVKSTRFSAILLSRQEAIAQMALSGVSGHMFTLSSAAKIGDVCSATGADTVGIATNLAVNFIGVIVGVVDGGGIQLYLEASDVGMAIASGSRVFVATNGIVWCMAGGTIAVTDTVVADTGTAGRVIAGTTTRTILGQSISGTTNSGSAVKILLRA